MEKVVQNAISDSNEDASAGSISDVSADGPNFFIK